MNGWGKRYKICAEKIQWLFQKYITYQHLYLKLLKLNLHHHQGLRFKTWARFEVTKQVQRLFLCFSKKCTSSHHPYLLFLKLNPYHHGFSPTMGINQGKINCDHSDSPRNAPSLSSVNKPNLCATNGVKKAPSAKMDLNLTNYTAFTAT